MYEIRLWNYGIQKFNYEKLNSKIRLWNDVENSFDIQKSIIIDYLFTDKSVMNLSSDFCNQNGYRIIRPLLDLVQIR